MTHTPEATPEAIPEAIPQPKSHEHSLRPGRRVVRFGIALRVSAALAGMVLVSTLTVGLAVWGIEKFRAGFVDIALVSHHQLTSVARLAQRAEATAAAVPRLIVPRDRFTLQQQHQFLDDQLRLVDDAFADVKASGIPPAVLADMHGHRQALLDNADRIVQTMSERISVAERLTLRLADLSTVFTRLRSRRADIAEGTSVDRALDRMEHAHALTLYSLGQNYTTGVRTLEGRSNDLMGAALDSIEAGQGDAWVGVKDLWLDLQAAIDGPDGVFALRGQLIDLEQRVQGLLIRNNMLSGRLSASASNLFTDMEAKLGEDRRAFAQLMQGVTIALVAALAATVLGTAALFLYMRRRVIGRLTGLQQTMQARAAGHPVPIPTTGNDEISDMAHSLAFFVTEIERREVALSSARDEAHRANDAKSSFLANMSHEIRTPMNAVIGLSRLALQTPLNDRQRDYLSKILGASQSLLGIINDILDFSKIEAGKLDLEDREFSLTDVLEDVGALLSGRAEEKGLEFVFQTDTTLPHRVIGDSLRLGQVLTNLTTNAVKFTDVGEVVVSVSVESERDDSVMLHFSVRDTGIGLSEEQQARLFAPFTQADTSTTRRFGGTGLGLSICYRLVEMMGGRLWVESAPDVGSTFHFTAKVKRACPALRDVTRWKDLRGTRVMIVDDNATARAILGEMLRSFECQVTECADGMAALTELDRARSAAEAPYEVVLMDWRMPRMDGLEASRRIKGSEGLDNLPVVIMVTAYGRDEVVREAETQQTIDGLLIKPVNASLLFDAMMQLIGHGEAGDDRRSVLGSLPSTTEADAILGGRHILLVEDNLLNQQVASEILAHWGIRVEVANDGREGLLALKEAGPDGYDLVLMDVQMPVMDGIEATRAVRRLEGFSDLPIVAMTAHALREERDRCLQAGMNDHVPKPVDPEHLCAVLCRLLADRPRRASGDAATPTPDPASVPAPPVGESAGALLPATLPGVDVAAALRRVMGNDRLLAKLLRDYARDHTNTGDDLNTLVEAGDWSAVREMAHALKGVSGNVGAMDVHGAAQALEKAVKVERLDDARDALAAVRAALGVVLDGLTVLAAPAPNPATTPATTPAPAEGPGPDVVARVFDDLERLDGMITSFDLEAVEVARALHDLLGPAHAAHTLPLLDATGALDFDAAQAAARELRSALEEARQPATTQGGQP